MAGETQHFFPRTAWSERLILFLPMLNNPHFHLRRLGAATCALVALAFASHAYAIALTSSNVIGIVLGAEPSDPSDETVRLQVFISLSSGGSIVFPDDATYLPTLPGPGTPTPLPGPASFGEKITTTTLPATSYTYLMAKFGPDAVYYYLGGQTGSIDSLFIPPNLGINGNGLSHISLFNRIGGGASVPDGGTTIALLGGAVWCLAILRRRFAR
jgi:hypothetical protein